MCRTAGSKFVRSRVALVAALVLVVGSTGCQFGTGDAQAAPVERAVVKPIPTVPELVVKAAGDSLVYPGSTPLEPSEEGQAYYLGMWPDAFPSVPMRIPPGTAATIAFTRDTSAQVNAYYGEALPAAGWALARHGEYLECFASVWQRDQTNLALLVDKIYPSQLALYADTVDIHLPDADAVIVATYVWQAE